MKKILISFLLALTISFGYSQGNHPLFTAPGFYNNVQQYGAALPPSSELRQVSAFVIDANGDLICIWQNGSTQNLGHVVGSDGIDGLPGLDGKDGDPGINGVNGINGIDGVSISSIIRTSGTGLAGSLDTYTITYSNSTTSTFTVQNGNNGANGSSGSGTSVGQEIAFVYPEAHGATGTNRTFQQDGKTQSYIDSVCPGIGATITDSRDWAGIQWCLTNANLRTIKLHGNYYTGSKDLLRPKYASTYISGPCIINIGAGATQGIGVSPATSLADGNVMENFTVTAEDVDIYISGSQTGFRFGPCFMARLIKCSSFGGNTGFLSEFQLQGIMDQCRTQNAQYGFRFLYSGIPGGGQSTSESNGWILNNCRTHTVSIVAVDINDSYHIVLNNFVQEGNGSITNGVRLVAAGSTDWDFTINGYHQEQSNTGAVFDINVYQSTVVINNPISHYSGLLINATSTTGIGLIKLSNCSYIKGNASGKYFTGNNISWYFDLCNAVPTPTEVTNRFTNTISQCSNPPGCGYGRFSGTWIPR